MSNDGSATKNIVQAAKIENILLLPSLMDNHPSVLVVTCDTQWEVTRKVGPPVEVCVTSGGLNDKKMVKSVEMEED